MPSGGDTPSCSPIRSITSWGRRGLSPRANRTHQAPLGEPTLQTEANQDPQTTMQGEGQEVGQAAMISVPRGGPGEGNHFVAHLPNAPTSDTESGIASASTVFTQGATTIGEEEPHGFIRSDTEPSPEVTAERAGPMDEESHQAPAEGDLRDNEDEEDQDPEPTECSTCWTPCRSASKTEKKRCQAASN